MAARQERIDAFIHEGHRQRTNRSRSCAKIASVRTSFRIYANGPRALGKMRKHADVSKPRCDRLAGVAGHAELGQLDEAWRCIGEALSIIETAKERWFEAEYRGRNCTQVAGAGGGERRRVFRAGARRRSRAAGQILGTPRRNEHGAALARSGQAAAKPTIFSLRFMTGSLKASIRLI